ncbi:MAG: oligosaccharide flippase family protein [Ignavibacteriaceae bacterium]
MSSLTRRTITLVISESLNYAVTFLSPIFLVRLLDIETYGQYREFIVYSSLILAFMSFGIKSNLLYFISKNPTKRNSFLTNTVYLLFIFSLVGLIIVFFLKSYIQNITSYNFIFLLMVYVFCFQNIDLLDSYWLAIKRSDYVLYWSSTNAIIRTALLLVVTYVTRNIWDIIYLLIILEILKTTFTIFYILRKKLFNWKLNRKLLKDQLNYILPNGFANVINKVNIDISKIFISVTLGPASLAIYAIGSQNIPFLNIIRNSVSNVIFPEIASQTNEDPKGALALWQKVNLLYLFLMAPLFIILFFYADIIIPTLFTEKYLDAIPLFRIYLILLLRKCFEMSIPIRAMNKNKYFVASNILYLVVNLILIYILFNLLGFIGPAIAAVISEIIQSIYLGNKIILTYQLRLSELLLWKEINKIILISLIGIPIFLINILISTDSIILSILFSIVYIIIYIIFFRRNRINEIDILMKKVLKSVRVNW